jgi:hypothetical protein
MAEKTVWPCGGVAALSDTSWHVLAKLFLKKMLLTGKNLSL